LSGQEIGDTSSFGKPAKYVYAVFDGSPQSSRMLQPNVSPAWPAVSVSSMTCPKRLPEIGFASSSGEDVPRALLFVSAMLSLIAGLLCFLREVYLAIRYLRLEID